MMSSLVCSTMPRADELARDGWTHDTRQTAYEPDFALPEPVYDALGRILERTVDLVDRCEAVDLEHAQSVCERLVLG